jgi:hypothetical protein
MRKINVLEFVSLDGVVQAPGGPEEDTSGGFAYGGWTSPHSDDVSGTAMRKQMNMIVKWNSSGKGFFRCDDPCDPVPVLMYSPSPSRNEGLRRRRRSVLGRSGVRG